MWRSPPRTRTPPWRATGRPSRRRRGGGSDGHRRGLRHHRDLHAHREPRRNPACGRTAAYQTPKRLAEKQISKPPAGSIRISTQMNSSGAGREKMLRRISAWETGRRCRKESETSSPVSLTGKTRRNGAAGRFRSQGRRHFFGTLAPTPSKCTPHLDLGLGGGRGKLTNFRISESWQSRVQRLRGHWLPCSHH